LWIYQGEKGATVRLFFFKIKVMARDNYKAWAVDITAFDVLKTSEEKLRFLLRFAVLAPSSHNSQPWKFEVVGGLIKIAPESSRRLPKSDTNDRQLFISLGCALQNILIAADYYGYQASTEYSNDGVVVHLAEVKNAQRDSKHLIFSILERRSNRNPYEASQPDTQLLEKIKHLSSDALHIHLVDDIAGREKIARVVIDAGIVAMNDDGFREELSEYVKSNYTSSPIGMPLFGFGMPGPLSMLGPTMLRKFNMNKLSARADFDLLAHKTPVLIIVTTKTDTKTDWIKTGQAYQQIALEAVRVGYSTATSAAPIQIGEFYKKFQEILQTDWRPQYFCRLGRAKKAPHHSPRLTSSAVTR
jgi:hypothetical protein